MFFSHSRRPQAAASARLHDLEFRAAQSAAAADSHVFPTRHSQAAAGARSRILQSRLAQAVACISLLAAAPAFAHISLGTPQASNQSGYKAVLKVSHGCKGSPTVKMRVRIPEGVVDVKPQAKDGWQISTVTGDYAQPYTVNGKKLQSGITEVAWTGGPLKDGVHDQFAFDAYLTDHIAPGSTLYFPVVQECEKGVNRWIDIPKDGGHGHHHGGSHDDSSPAPGLKIAPAR